MNRTKETVLCFYYCMGLIKCTACGKIRLEFGEIEVCPGSFRIPPAIWVESVSLGLAGLWSSAFEGGVAARIANPLRSLFQLLFPPSVLKVLRAALASPSVSSGLPIVDVNKFFVPLIYSFRLHVPSSSL